MRDRPPPQPHFAFRFAQEGRSQLPHTPQFAPHQADDPLADTRRDARRSIIRRPLLARRARKGGFRFFGGEALGPHHRLAVVGLQLQPLVRGDGLSWNPRRRPRRLVRHGDRFAEMGDRLLERGAPQRLVAGLAPPFDREVVEAGLREMMGDDFRLGRGAVGLSRRISAARRCSAWRRLLSRLS